MCNESGGVEADLTVTDLGGHAYYFAAGGNTATKDLEWMRRNVERLGLDARVDDHSASLAMLSVQGPRSRELVHALMESGAAAAAAAAAAEAAAAAAAAGGQRESESDNAVVAASSSLPLLSSPSPSNLSFSTAARVHLGKQGREALCLRLTFVGELGFELHVPSEHAAEVYAELRAIGEAMGEKDGFPVRCVSIYIYIYIYMYLSISIDLSLLYLASLSNLSIYLSIYIPPHLATPGTARSTPSPPRRTTGTGTRTYPTGTRRWRRG